jgi:hypothetical protein
VSISLLLVKEDKLVNSNECYIDILVRSFFDFCYR